MEDESAMDEQDLASEDQVTDSEQQEQPPARVVPLEALEAERRKRQDLEAQNRALQELMVKSKPTKDDVVDEDEEDFITVAEMKKRLKDVTFTQKREILEEAFVDSKPEAIELIDKHLDDILKRKPWLAQTIDSAPNRYARAYEIIQDYMPKTASASRFTSPQAEAKRLVENSQKPGNPAAISKASNSSSLDYLKSIQGKPEFREYRRKMLGGG